MHICEKHRTVMSNDYSPCPLCFKEVSEIFKEKVNDKYESPSFLDETDLQFPIKTPSKYDRPCKGITIDVYDVLKAFNVDNPALQHLIKKALCCGLRGHKDRMQDVLEVLESAKRAVELEEQL